MSNASHTMLETDRDELRHAFLVKLSASNVHVTDWEHKFINQNCGLTRFTDGQRFVIDNLHKRYALQLPLPKTAKPHPTRRAPMPAARALDLFQHARKAVGI